MTVNNKRYYWLKLKEDFFEEDTIEWLEEQENGVFYSNFYLKLCLKSLKTNGILIRSVGELLIPYDIKKLAEITHVKLDTAIVAMELFKKIGLVQILENGEIYLTQLELMVGSETSKAALMRKKRKKDKEHNLNGRTQGQGIDGKSEGSDSDENNDELEDKNHKSDVSNNVTSQLPECYSEKEKEQHKELEYRYKDEKLENENTEKEVQKELEQNKHKEKDIKKDKHKNGKLQKDKSLKENNMNSKKLDKGVVHNSFDKYEIAVDNDADYYGESYNYASEDYMKNLNVYKHFEKCGFKVTAQLIEFICTDIKKYGEEWMYKAAEECVRRGKSDNYGYLTGILENWYQKGRAEYGKSCKQNSMAYDPMTSILDE